MRFINKLMAAGFVLCLGSSLFAQEDFRKNPPAAGPAPSIEIGDAEQFTLKNGLKVILVENDKLPRVTFQLSVDVPDFSEGEKAGYVSMTGDLLSRGTTSRTKAEIDEAIDFIGASMSSYGSGIFGSSLSKNTDALLEVMSDVLLNPVFPEEEFEKIKKSVLSNIAQTPSSPDAIMSNVRRTVLYGASHPFGSVETEETINNISVADCKDYYNTYFKPNISYLVIVGDMNKKEAMTVAEKYFGSWKAADVPQTRIAAVKRPKGVNVVFVDKPGAVQSTIAVSYPVDFSLKSDDYIAGSLMSTVLGGYFGSRLNQNLREDKAYTYGARGGLRANKLIGNFSASASVRNEVTDSSITEMIYEMDQILNTPLTEEELSMVKNFRTGNFAIGLERPRTVADFALNTIIYDLEDDFYANYLKTMNALSVEDMNKVAKSYFDMSNAYIIVVGNKGEVAEKLLQFDTDGEIDYYDAFGNEIEKIEMNESVTAEMVVNKYIDAIGGREALNEVNVISSSYAASTAFGEIKRNVAVSKDGNLAEEVSMGGMTMSETKINGDNGYIVAQGNKVIMTSDEVAAKKKESVPFPELNYFKENAFQSIELSGVEEVEGEKAYRVDFKMENGMSMAEYYSLDSALKIRMILTTGEGPTITFDFTDFKEYEGLLLPSVNKISGMAPVPLEMKIQKVEINPEYSEMLFKLID